MNITWKDVLRGLPERENFSNNLQRSALYESGEESHWENSWKDADISFATWVWEEPAKSAFNTMSLLKPLPWYRSFQ